MAAFVGGFFMLKQILATKRHMTQGWTKDGLRIPMTVVMADTCVVMGKATVDGRITLGNGVKKLKNVKKPQRSQLEKAGFSFGVTRIKEVMADSGDQETLTPGTKIVPSSVLTVGDIVKVTGTSKGKGFTGVVKRHGFAGGPRTHGQSDRERAPGSLGSGTTPGRVFRNKRMAGRAGNEQVTTLGLQVVALNDQTGEITLKGIVPGTMNSPVMITKVSEGKFDGLIVQEAASVMTAAPVVEEVAPTEEKQEEVVSAEVQAPAQETVTE